MSLINKMLQDLESRNNAQADTASRKSVYEDLKPVKASPFVAPPKKRLGVIVLALVVVAGGAYAWMQWGEQLLTGGSATVKTRTVAARKAPPKPAAVPKPAPVVPVGVTPSSTAKQTPVDTEPATAKPMEAPAAKTQPANADQASRSEPETTAVPVATPGEQKNISTTTPPPAPVPEGGYWTVAKGETLYGISIKSGIALSDLSGWNRLGRDHVIHPGQRLRLTPPDAEAVKTVAVSPDRNGPRKQETNKVMTAMTPVKKPATKVVAPTAPPASPSPPEETSADNTVMSKKLKPLSPDEQAESEYRQAVSLLQNGRAADAEKHLRAALNFSAAHPPSRELLAGLELQNGRWHEAQQTLEQGIEKVPSYYPFALLLARIQIEHGADPKALAVMEASRKAGAGSADYMTFLAELYRRAGNQAEAIKAYTEAIKLNPQEGRSWMGMGISLEATQDWNAAAGAYQRAIETGSLDDSLLKYARQRLAIVKNK